MQAAPPRTVRAAHAFQPTGPGQLELRPGQRLEVREEAPPDAPGWVRCGLVDGREGLVPASYVEPCSPPTPPARAPAWVRVDGEDGVPYYHNTQTGETRWEPPPGLQAAEELPMPPPPPPLESPPASPRSRGSSGGSGVSLGLDAVDRRLAENSAAKAGGGGHAVPSLDGRKAYPVAGPVLRRLSMRRAAAAASPATAPVLSSPQFGSSASSLLPAPDEACEDGASPPGGSPRGLVGAAATAAVPEAVRAAAPGLGARAAGVVTAADEDEGRVRVEFDLGGGATLAAWVPAADVCPDADGAQEWLRQARADPRRRARRTTLVSVGLSQVPGAGAGLFVDEPVRRGAVVAHVTGRVVADAEQRAMKPADARYLHSFWPDAGSAFRGGVASHAGGEVHVDARGTLWGAINHRWEEAGHPLGAANVVVASGGQVLALRDIHAGEELYRDYGEDYWVFALHGVRVSAVEAPVALELREFVRRKTPNGPLRPRRGRRKPAGPAGAGVDRGAQTELMGHASAGGAVEFSCDKALTPALRAQIGGGAKAALEASEQREALLAARERKLAEAERAREEEAGGGVPSCLARKSTKAAVALSLLLGGVLLTLLLVTGNTS